MNCYKMLMHLDHSVRGNFRVTSNLRRTLEKSSSTGCPGKIVPSLCGYCGGAVDSIVKVLQNCIG